MTRRHSISRDLLFLTATLAAVTAVAATLRRVHNVSPMTVALALLLVVLAAATLSRLWVAIVTSAVAMLVINFFFMPPLGTFTIADPQNWVALFVFLSVAIIASNLSASAQARAREAIARRNEVTRLFDLSRDVLLTTEIAGAPAALARHIARRFELGAATVCLPIERGWAKHHGGENTLAPDDGQLDIALARARGALEFDARQRTYGGHMRVTTGEGSAQMLVPLRVGVKPVGLLATPADVLDPGTLDAVAGVAAIAIERIQFLSERKEAEGIRQRADFASALLASLSHDLRTPLTAIRVAVENLERGLSDSERIEQGELAVRQLDHLNRVFQDILDMARIDAEAVIPDLQWVAPEEIVDAAVAHSGVSARPLRIEADTDTAVYVDPKLTSGALAHLLENADQYSPPGTPIDVRAAIADDGLRITVTDAGPGLDPAEMERLFDRFYRGRAAGARSFGTGMGLAIARGLLAAEGGRVWGEDTGTGARFTIAVPCRVRVVASQG
jgi:two-component system, OmpR family, sensor histidine kinase KdpD